MGQRPDLNPTVGPARVSLAYLGWILMLSMTTVAVVPPRSCQAFPCTQEAAAIIRPLQSGTIGEGADATPWVRIDSGQPGPTVLVVGGVHGNEPAGYWAATQIGNWPIVKGSLIVVPSMNRLGRKANLRWQPEFRNDRQRRDLNRNFPTKETPQAATSLAEHAWNFVCQQRPDWVFDLHEGFDIHRANSKSVGSSVIAFETDAQFAQSLVDAVNLGLPEAGQFDLLAGSGPASGSLARASGELLGAHSFILETTTRSQPLSTRVRQHRILMSRTLIQIGLIDQAAIDRIMPPATAVLQRIGVFDGPGAEAAPFLKLLNGQDHCVVCPLGPEDIDTAVLDQMDVVIFPGGSGSRQGTAIGVAGRQRIREYVQGGGGIVGVCAGAYLCSSHYSWSLDVMNAAVYNRTVDIPNVGRKSMWYRGKPAMVDVEFSAAGQAALERSGLHSIRYHNGPILSAGDRPDLPAFETWARFRSENSLYEAQQGTMVNTPAIVHSRYGQGRVIAISPHFESTSGKEDLILQAISVVCRR